MKTKKLPINSASGYGEACSEIMRAVHKVLRGRTCPIAKDLEDKISDLLEDYPSENCEYDFYLD